MTENERRLHDEIDRLRHEAAELRRDRDRLHQAVCQMLPLEEVQWTEDEVRQRLKEDVTILDLLQESQDPRPQGPPNGAAALAQDHLGANP